MYLTFHCKKKHLQAIRYTLITTKEQKYIPFALHLLYIRDTTHA